MKITVSDLDGELDDIVLGDDDAGDLVVDPPPLPAEKRAVQITGLFRGTNPFARGRGNRDIGFAWVVARDHADANTAGQFSRRHAELVPINCTVTVDEGDAQDVYSRAVMVAVAPVERFGKATTFRYEVTGAVLAAQATD